MFRTEAAPQHPVKDKDRMAIIRQKYLKGSPHPDCVRDAITYAEGARDHHWQSKQARKNPETRALEIKRYEDAISSALRGDISKLEDVVKLDALTLTPISTRTNVHKNKLALQNLAAQLNKSYIKIVQ